MTAGRGIVHSERTPEQARTAPSTLHGIQSWVALPDGHEEIEPSFVHHDRDALPFLEMGGARVRLIAGTLYGERAPVRTLSELFYADVTLVDQVSLPLPAEHEERAVYLVEGGLELAGERFEAGQMLLFGPGDEIPLRAQSATRLLLLGGAPLESRRHIWWNFVSSSQERIEQAKADWQAGRFAPVPGETESIPLPAR